MNHKISVSLSFDQGYSEQATIMLYSLLSNNLNNSFNVYAFYNDLNDSFKKKIEHNLSRFKNFELEWIKFDPSFTKNFTIRKGHVNEYTYTRLYMPRYLKHLSQLLYLDCDMLILDDILPLWQTDLKGKTIGAIEEPSVFTRHEDLGMPEGKKYFNAGMLLLDINKWNEHNYTDVVVNKLTELEGKAAFWDQDGLNATMYNDWLQLDGRWNLQSHTVAVAQDKKVKNLKAVLAPKIIHFTGNLKPWNYKSSNPYKKEYYTYLKQTGFYKTHKPQNKTATNIARRSIRNVLIALGFLKY